MLPFFRFLVIDHHADSRALLARSYDEWLSIGNVMAGLLAETRSPFESSRPVDDSPEPPSV
jgi:hypothetical protein